MASPLKKQKQSRKERPKTRRAKRKTPSRFAVRGFPVDPSLYHLIDNETFGSSEEVLDSERPNLLYSLNFNRRFRRTGRQGFITDKRNELKTSIQDDLYSEYLTKDATADDKSNLFQRNQTLDIVENGSEEAGKVVEGNKIIRMFNGLRDSVYDGASDEEIRTMFHGTIAGYESNREKKLKADLEDLDKNLKALMDMEQQEIEEGTMTEKQAEGYENARKSLSEAKELWQNELAEILKEKRIKIDRGLQAQKKIYYQHLKRIVEKYGKYITQINVYDFMSVNPADQVASDLGFLQDANLLLRHCPEIVDMSIKEDREFLAMLHFAQTMQHYLSSYQSPVTISLAMSSSSSNPFGNDQESFGSNPQQIGQTLRTDTENISLFSQDLSLTGDLLQSLGVSMRGLNKKEGKAYMKSAQKRGLLMQGEKQALESIGKSPNISGYVKQCIEDLGTIKETIKEQPIPGETGQNIKTLCTLADQFLIKHEPTDLPMLQTICWELTKKCDTMFGSGYGSLFEGDNGKSTPFCDLLNPFLRRLQFILQTQQNLVRMIGIE